MVAPGAMELHLMPCAPYMRAPFFVIANTARFVGAYAGQPIPMVAVVDETLTIDPR
jgi:hypothetical protein